MSNVVQIILKGEDKTGGAFNKALGGVQRFGKLAMGVLAGVGGAAVAAGAGLLKLAADAEPLAGVKSAFEGVTASMEGGSAAMLAALQEGSAGLITNRDLMTSFNKAQALVSKDFATQLPGAMALVRKAAASTGQDMGFLMDSLVTGVGRVSPMILDNLGIQVSLAAVTERASEMFGKQADELSKVEQQTALQAVVMEKLNEAYADVPDVVPITQKIRTTFANLKDEIGLKLLPFLNKMGGVFESLAAAVLPKLTSFMDGTLVPILTRVGSMFGGLAYWIEQGKGPVELFAWALDTLVEGLGLAQGDVSGLGTRFKELAGAASDLWTAFEWILTGQGDNIDWWHDIARAIGLSGEAADTFSRIMFDVGAALSDGIGWLSEQIAKYVEWKDVLIAAGIAVAAVVVPIILGIIGTIVSIAAPIVAVIAAVALLRNAWENNWGGIRDKVQAVIDFIVPFVKNAIAAIRAWWAENGEEILAKAADVWGSIKSVISQVLELIQAIVGRVMSTVRTIWDNYGQEILGLASAVWESIKTVISTVFGVIQGLLSTFTALFRGDWEAFGEGLRGIWSTLWEGIKSIVGTLWGGISPLLAAFWTSISGWFEGIDWAQLGQTIVDAIVNVAGTLWDMAKSAFESFWTAAGEWFDEIDWGGLGQKIIDGIVAALRAGVTAVGQAAQGLAEGAYNWITGFIRSDSPSRLFMEVGQSIADGLIVGIQRRAKAAQEAVAGLLEIGQDLGSIASGFGGIFRDRLLGPAKEGYEGAADRLGDLSKKLEAVQKSTGWSLEQMAEYSQKFPLAFLGHATAEEWGYLQQLPDALDEYNEKRARYNELLEKQTKLEQAQQNLKFLQYQMDLLKLIGEHKLDAKSILGGIELGTGADLGGIVEAMTRALQAVVEKTSQQLLGYQHGGSFVVGGAGGVDSQLIAFRASPGERVTITPAGMSAQPAVVNNNYYLTAQYQNTQSEGSLRGDVRSMRLLYGG